MVQADKPNIVRSFGLNKEDCKTREDHKFYKAALKAYLNGKKKFRYGYTIIKHQRVPAYFKTPINYGRKEEE